MIVQLLVRRFSFILAILLLSFDGFSQDLIVVSKVQNDSIFIKWLPSDFDQFLQITKGAKVSRVESLETINFQSIDFSNAKEWTIAPMKMRYDKLDLSIEVNDRAAAFLEPFIDVSNNQELNSFAFGAALLENVINPGFQYILGNIIVDGEVETSKSYVYKVEIDGLSASYLFVDASKPTKNTTIQIGLSLDRKKTVDITWDYKSIVKEATGYEVEHSIDSITEGNYLNDLPFLPFQSQYEIKDKKALYRDESPEEGHFHFYRIHGRDQFAEKSLVSNWEKIYVPELIHAWVEVDTVIVKNEIREIVVIVHPTKSNPKVNSVRLLRSLDKDSGYELIETRTFNDTIYTFTISGKKSGDHFYYRAEIFGKDEVQSSLPVYFFTLDQEPPEMPTSISGTIDSVGIARLKWGASNDDDILGYRVFRANQKREEFVEQTSELLVNLNFMDTLGLDNLTSEVYYFIQAVDLNYNQSPTSDTLLLMKPDTIAPVPCVLKQVKMLDTGLLVLWVNSDSEDLVSSFLIRDEVDTLIIANQKVMYADTSVVPGRSYSYKLLSIDKSGNTSSSSKISQFYEPGFREALSTFSGEVNREEKLIKLKWNKPLEQVYSYQLYRVKGDGKLRLLKTLSAENSSYEDSQLNIGNQYTYALKYITMSGIHSIPVEIQILY